MSAINKTWVLAGHAIFTVGTSAAAQQAGFQPHYTFLIAKKKLPASGHFEASTKWFAKLLTGPDNEADYAYVGSVDEQTGAVKLTANSKLTEGAKALQVLRRVLARVWADEAGSVNANGWSLHHAGCCGRCGALLTVPESVVSGYGPECVKRATGLSMKRYLNEIGGTAEADAMSAAEEAAEELAEREATEHDEAQRAYEMAAA